MGSFFKDKRHGHGTHTYSNGNKVRYSHFSPAVHAQHCSQVLARCCCSTWADGNKTYARVKAHVSIPEKAPIPERGYRTEKKDSYVD